MSLSARGILERLDNHIDRLLKNLSVAFAEASERHAGTPEAVASSREQYLRSVIRRFFPEPYKVTKGAIYDSYDSRSQSIDCVICAPNHPNLIGIDGEIEILLVEGVFAAIELKPDLKDLPNNFGTTRQQKPEIIRGLEQIRTVKKLKRISSFFGKHQEIVESFKKELGVDNSIDSDTQSLLEHSLRCPGYIFANDSRSICELAKYVVDWYIKNDIPPIEQVDGIFVIKKGLILNSKVPKWQYTKMENDESWYPHMTAYESGTLSNKMFITSLVGQLSPCENDPFLFSYLNRNSPPIKKLFKTTKY